MLRPHGGLIDDSLAGINWAQAKADLIADEFDNGRTADALRRSFGQSRHVAIARDGERVVGLARGPRLPIAGRGCLADDAAADRRAPPVSTSGSRRTTPRRSTNRSASSRSRSSGQSSPGPGSTTTPTADEGLEHDLGRETV